MTRLRGDQPTERAMSSKLERRKSEICSPPGSKSPKYSSTQRLPSASFCLKRRMKPARTFKSPQPPTLAIGMQNSAHGLANRFLVFDFSVAIWTYVSGSSQKENGV